MRRVIMLSTGGYRDRPPRGFPLWQAKVRLRRQCPQDYAPPRPARLPRPGSRGRAVNYGGWTLRGAWGVHRQIARGRQRWTRKWSDLRATQVVAEEPMGMSTTGNRRGGQPRTKDKGLAKCGGPCKHLILKHAARGTFLRVWQGLGKILPDRGVHRGGITMPNRSLLALRARRVLAPTELEVRRPGHATTC